MSCDVGRERVIEPNHARDLLQPFVVEAQGTVVMSPLSCPVGQNGKQIGSGGAVHPIFVDDVPRMGVYPHPQRAVGLLTLIDHVAATELRLFQMGNVDKRHALHVDAEEEEVARKLQGRTGQAKGHQPLDDTLGQGPFAGPLTAGKHFAERALVLTDKLLVDRIVVGRAQHAHVERHGVHLQPALHKKVLKIPQQRHGKGADGNVFSAAKGNELPQCTTIVCLRLVFSLQSKTLNASGHQPEKAFFF